MKVVSSIDLIFLLLALGCSTASVRVMPGEDGNNKVVARDIEKDGAEEAAVKAANKYCKSKNQEAVYSGDKTNYTGSMDEETRNTVRNASKAAVILGGPSMGGMGDPSPGAVVGTAGTVGYSMTSDKDYESVVTFKCK
jgi:hypothetical protein